MVDHWLTLLLILVGFFCFVLVAAWIERQKHK